MPRRSAADRDLRRSGAVARRPAVPPPPRCGNRASAGDTSRGGSSPAAYSIRSSATPRPRRGGDMDFVCDLLARMAVKFNVAVDSPHHVHKGQVTPGDADSGRDAGG